MKLLAALLLLGASAAHGQATASVSLCTVSMVTSVGRAPGRLTLQLPGVQNRVVGWQSRYPKVATVDSTGLVTAQSPGTATIVEKFVNGGTITFRVYVLRKNADGTMNTGALPDGSKSQAGGCTLPRGTS